MSSGVLEKRDHHLHGKEKSTTLFHTALRAQSNHHTRWFLARDADAVLFTPQSYNLPAIASSALPVLRVKVLWANKVVALEEKRVLSVEPHKLFIMGGYDGLSA